MATEIEIHDDRTRMVHVVSREDDRKPRTVLRSRPMRLDEIKSGEWQPPGLDDAGEPLSPRFNRANTPDAYRRLCESLVSKGFTPLSPLPVATTSIAEKK